MPVATRVRSSGGISIQLKPGRPRREQPKLRDLGGAETARVHHFLDGGGHHLAEVAERKRPRGSSPCSANEAFQVTKDAMADVARIFGYLRIEESA